MRYGHKWVLLLKTGQVEHALGRDDSPQIIGDCRAGLELNPGQGCSAPDGGAFSIRADGCVGDPPSVANVTGGGFFVVGLWTRTNLRACGFGQMSFRRFSRWTACSNDWSR